MSFKGIVGNADEITDKRWTGFRSRFVYRPAALWLGWMFIASISSVVFILVMAYHVWETFHPSATWMLTNFAPYVLAALIPAAFGIVYASLMYQLAKGFTINLGDAGTYHMSQQTPLGSIVTKDEFESIDDPDFSTKPEYIGQTIVRNKVRLWGRLGGVKNWPGWDGGKKDGYYDVVYDWWDEIGGKVVRAEVPCDACNGRGRIKKIASDGADLSSAKYTPGELDELNKAIPGFKLGTVISLPYEAWPLDMDEIPEELARAIRDDPEWRASSGIWEMEDVIPSRVAMGSTMPSNSLVTMWGRERTNRMLRDRLLELTMQLAMVRGMSEEAMSGVQPPQIGSGEYGRGYGQRP